MLSLLLAVCCLLQLEGETSNKMSRHWGPGDWTGDPGERAESKHLPPGSQRAQGVFMWESEYAGPICCSWHARERQLQTDGAVKPQLLGTWAIRKGCSVTSEPTHPRSNTPRWSGLAAEEAAGGHVGLHLRAAQR